MFRSLNVRFLVKEFFGPQEQVDYFLLGVFVGFLELITKKKLYGYEINCKAQKGVQNCSFLIASKEKISDYLKNNAKNELNRANAFFKMIDSLDKDLVKNVSWHRP